MVVFVVVVEREGDEEVVVDDVRVVVVVVSRFGCVSVVAAAVVFLEEVEELVAEVFLDEDVVVELAVDAAERDEPDVEVVVVLFAA